MSTSIFLDHLDFQIIEIHAVHEIVLGEPGLAQALEINAVPFIYMAIPPKICRLLFRGKSITMESSRGRAAGR